MADLMTALSAAAGAAAGGENLYVEDVFSTYLYTGNGSTQTITNDIDLDGEGGLVWIKPRTAATFPNHILFDTARGVSLSLTTNNTDGNDTNSISSFNVDGFSLTSSQRTNQSGESYASWTFRKAEKFFDVVTYTGNGANRTISHNIGSVPGCIIVKRTNTTGNWQVYHRANTAAPETDYLVLNTTAATADSNTRWNDTLPTDSVFSLGTEATVNANGGTYVAYLFAHDAGGFGDDGLQNVISCGSYTGDGTTTRVVTTGFEPQWILLKRTNITSNWFLFDVMRGFNYLDAYQLLPNTSDAENGYALAVISPTANGFTFPGSSAYFNSSGETWIYIAIRRGPMKTPTVGTEVFGLNARTGTGANATVTGSAGVSDAVLIKNRGALAGSLFAARLTNTGYLQTSSTAAEVAAASTILQANPWDVMDGVKVGTTSTITNASANTYINYLFNRAPGFFDVVCDAGTGSAHTISHNLGVVPELMIRKKRSDIDNWIVYAGDPTDYLRLNATSATADLNTMWDDTAPTSSAFTVGTNDDVNQNGANFITYLFASLPGVSKIGTYTGNGSSVTVTTGFQPRFILVKRTNSTGNWIYGDSARGLVAGDDPFSILNTTAAETTNQDWVDVSATGFTVNETAANANVNTGIYLYLAIS
jgi:hypothetical protein